MVIMSLALKKFDLSTVPKHFVMLAIGRRRSGKTTAILSLMKAFKNRDWSDEEDERIMQLLQLHGRNFKKIARELNRGEKQTANHCQSGPFGKKVGAKFPPKARQQS